MKRVRGSVNWLSVTFLGLMGFVLGGCPQLGTLAVMYIVVFGVPGGHSGGGNDPEPPSSDPNHPPDTRVVVNCGSTQLEVWSGGRVESTSGYVWAALERQGELISHSAGDYVHGGSFYGWYLYVPLDGLQLDSRQYSVSLYFSPTLVGVGDPKTSLARSTDFSWLQFPSEVIQSVAMKTKSYVRSAATSIDSTFCLNVDDTMIFTVTRFGLDSMWLRRGHNYEDNLIWSVGGSKYPRAGTISNNGRFIATRVAPYVGDCYVIVEDTAADLIDSAVVGVFVPCDNVEVELYSDNEQIGSGSCLFIDSIPLMPNLVARVNDGLDGDIAWMFQVTYSRSGRHDVASFLDTLPADEDWEINASLSGAFIGGEAMIEAIHINSACGDYLQFGIRGRNPTEAEAETYITGLGGLWYWKYVAMWESDRPSQTRYYAQFNEVGSYDCSITDVRYTPNSSNTGDGGFGIFQLTNPVPNSQKLWNWKSNVDAGTALLQTKQSQANTVMATDRAAAAAYYGEDPSSPVLSRPPTYYEGNVVFQDVTAIPVEHAVALKRYNGLGSVSPRDYCEWDAGLDQWVKTDWATYQGGTNYYVHDVCSLVP